MRNTGRIRKDLTIDACKTLALALVTSRPDCAKSLQYGLPSTLMGRLEKVHNSTARLVTCTHKREHISPVFYSLHWLSMLYSSQYNILFYAYKAIFGTAVQCLVQSVYHPRCVTHGNRCFDKAAASPWNDILVNIWMSPIKWF